MGVQPVADAAAWAEKMLRNAANASQDWERGMQNPSASPTAQMKKAKTRYKTEMQTALTEDRWAKAIDKLSDEEIIAAAMKAGGGAFVTGLTNRSEKVLKAIQSLQPLVVSLKARLDGMPTDTDQQRETKMIEAKRGMQAIGRQLAGLAR